MDTSIFPSLGRTLLAIALFGLGQFPASISAEESTGSEPAAPRLLHDPVAVASAPLPDPTPKPVVLPPAVVLDTVEYVLPAEGRSIIVQKTEPPPGYIPPPVNPPPAPLPAVPSEEFLAKARAAAANRPRMRYLRFSATVYPGGPEDAARKATLVRWTHDRQNYQAWSSIDWNHFRGLGRFASADGKTIYSCLMGIGDATRWRQRPGSPVPPDFQAGEITYQIFEGDAGNQAGLADLETLHNLYRTDGHRLKLAHEIREKAIAERQAWLEANPPQPQDIIVRHWDVTPPAPESNPTTGTEARP